MSIDPPSYREAIEIGIKKQLKISTNKLHIEEVSRLLKNGFSKKGKTQI